jgi:SAM-dependent methyltransferase
MSTGYALAYRLGITPWERAGEAARASFDALLDREERERGVVAGGSRGRALDLGCGRGAHTHELAERGWEAVGVDNISRAVGSARERAGSGATFVDGDVTRLDRAVLGTFDFFLDIGCFHGLSTEERKAEAAGVTRLANPGATILLLAFRPNRMPLLPGGVGAGGIESAFVGWELLSVEPADTSGMPGPMQRTAPHWYRLRLKV